MYYGVIFLLLSLISLYSFYYPNTVYYPKFKVIAFLLLVLTSGLRYETAVDCYSYAKFFGVVEPIYVIFNNSITDFFLKYSEEPGFTLLNSLVKTFTNDVQVLFFLISFFTTTLLFKSLRIYCERKYFLFSILIYYSTLFFIIDMSGIRQCIAVNIILFAIKYLEEKRDIQFLAFVTLAGLFHFSAFIFLFAPFILRKEFKTYFLLIFMSLGLILFLFRFKWLTLSIQSLESIFSGNLLFMKLLAYTTVTAVFSKERSVFFMLFINAFLFLLIIYGRKKIWKKEVINTVFFNLFFGYFFFTCVFWEIFEIGFRLGLYCVLGFVYFLPKIVDIFTTKTRSMILIALIIYSFMNIRIFITEDKSVITYNPYQNYIIYKTFDIKSTGPQRLEKYIEDVGGEE